MVLEMEAPEELRGLARKELSKIAAREFKARGQRIDAVFYLLDAMRLFHNKLLPEIQEITFKIVMRWQRGAGHQQPVKVPWREIGNDQTRGRSNDTSTSLTDATSEVLSPSTGAYI